MLTDHQFHVTTSEPPSPGPREVLIRGAYAGVQWGDVMVRDGLMPTEQGFVPGFELAGHVAGVGVDVQDFQVGQLVIALTTSGAFSEMTTASADLTIAADDLAPRTAGAFGWATPTAYDLINDAGRVRAGESVLIHAASGGVGTLAAQFAKAAGATRVVGVVGNDEKKAYAAGFGCDALVTRDEFPDALDPSSFDVILDPVGTRTREINVELLAPGGRLVVFGNLSGFEPVMISSNDLLVHGKSVLGYNSVLLSRTHPGRLMRSAREALAMVRSGDVRIHVSAEHPLDDVATAVEQLATGGVLGKSVLALG